MQAEKENVPAGAVAVQIHHPMTRALARGVIALDRLLRKAVLKLSFSELSPGKYDELCAQSAQKVVERLAIEIDEAVEGIPPHLFERKEPA